MILTGRIGRWLACILAATLLLSGVGREGAAAGSRLYEVFIDGKFGFIDQTGAMMTEPVFKAVRPSQDGMAAAELATGEWVFIDAAGGIATPPTPDIPGFYSEGLVAVKVDGLYGYMDKAGRMVIQPAYEQAFPFRAGRAMVVKDGAVGYIDAGGAVAERLPFLRPTGNKTDVVAESGAVLGQVYLEVWDESGDRIPFERDGKMGFLDRRGRVVIEPLYRPANQYGFRAGSFFNERIIPVSLNGKTGFIDREGRVAVDFIFDRAELFREGLSQVSKDGRHGFIDTDGKIVVALQFEFAEDFSEGLAAVRVDGRWGFIDKTGRMVIEPAYLGLMWGVPIRFREGLAVVRTEAGTGYINKANEFVVPPVYWHGDDFSGGLAKVYRKRSREFEYVNRQGGTVWPSGP